MPIEDVRAIGRAVGVTVERRLAGGMWGAAFGEQVVTVQEFIAGETPDVFEADQARQLIELWQWHRDRADDVGDDPLAGVRSATAPDCVTLQAATDPAIRALYEEARAVVEANDPSIFRTTDIVHHDFHHRNFLVRDGRVVAVFDWEGATGGDSRVDLCGLAWTTRPGLPSRTPDADALTAAVVAREVDPDVAAALAAGRAIEKLAFGLRSGAEIRADVLAAVHACMRPHW